MQDTIQEEEPIRAIGVTARDTAGLIRARLRETTVLRPTATTGQIRIATVGHLPIAITVRDPDRTMDSITDLTAEITTDIIAATTAGITAVTAAGTTGHIMGRMPEDIIDPIIDLITDTDTAITDGVALTTTNPTTHLSPGAIRDINPSLLRDYHFSSASSGLSENCYFEPKARNLVPISD